MFVWLPTLEKYLSYTASASTATANDWGDGTLILNAVLRIKLRAALHDTGT
jgi:hypothetical protein